MKQAFLLILSYLANFTVAANFLGYMTFYIYVVCINFKLLLLVYFPFALYFCISKFSVEIFIPLIFMGIPLKVLTF